MNTLIFQTADEEIALNLTGICFARYTKSTKNLYISYGTAFVECTGVELEQWESVRVALCSAEATYLHRTDFRCSLNDQTLSTRS